MLGCSKGQPQARARGVGWLRVEATYSFAQGASARFRPYRKTSQSTSAARMISRTASVIPNTNAQVLNSSTVALFAAAQAK